MKNIKNKFIPLSISILAILSLSFFGCMDLFDDYETWLEGTSSGIQIDWDDNQGVDIITYTVNEKTIHFSGPEGCKSYQWFIDVRDPVGTEREYDWDTSSVANRSHYVTLIVQYTDESTKWQTLYISLFKE